MAAVRCLVRLTGASVRYGDPYGEQWALRDLSLDLRVGEHLAISGANGSGKSTLLRLISGELWPAPGFGDGVERRVYDLGAGPETDAVTARQRIRVVGPESQDLYSHRRLNLRGRDIVATGLADSPILRRRLTAAEERQVTKCLLRLGARGLEERRFLELSRGEQRKLLIARALVSDPAVLCLDEICDGLDRESATRLLETLDRIAGQGVTLVLATHHRDEVPSAVRRWLFLEAGRAVPAPAASGDATIARSQSFVPGSRPAIRGHVPALIEVRRADVYRGRRRVLADLNWRLDRGTHWLLHGANGAGKSTFMKLLYAELRPAAGGQIRWFGLASRTDVWTLRRRIGFVSDELQALHLDRLTVRQCVATGFVASIGRVPRLDPAQQAQVSHWLEKLGLLPLADSGIRQLSYGQLRRTLLARALVTEPEVLLLDEPGSGLDRATDQVFRQVLHEVAARGTHLVMAAHRGDVGGGLFTDELEIRDGRLRARHVRSIAPRPQASRGPVPRR